MGISRTKEYIDAMQRCSVGTVWCVQLIGAVVQITKSYFSLIQWYLLVQFGRGRYSLVQDGTLGTGQRLVEPTL